MSIFIQILFLEKYALMDNFIVNVPCHLFIVPR